VYVGVGEMLDALRDAGRVMCIATSKRRDFADRVIDHLGLRTYIHAVYGAIPGGGLDDKQDLLAHILAHESFDPAHTMMLGDRLHDMHAARHNNLRAIGALWGYGGREELLTAGADAIADMPKDVPGLVEP
jgi:phosphoglycolate phosphatase